VNSKEKTKKQSPNIPNCEGDLMKPFYSRKKGKGRLADGRGEGGKEIRETGEEKEKNRHFIFVLIHSKEKTPSFTLSTGKRNMGSKGRKERNRRVY